MIGRYGIAIVVNCLVALVGVVLLVTARNTREVRLGALVVVFALAAIVVEVLHAAGVIP